MGVTYLLTIDNADRFIGNLYTFLISISWDSVDIGLRQRINKSHGIVVLSFLEARRCYAFQACRLIFFFSMFGPQISRQGSLLFAWSNEDA